MSASSSITNNGEKIIRRQ